MKKHLYWLPVILFFSAAACERHYDNYKYEITWTHGDAKCFDYADSYKIVDGCLFFDGPKHGDIIICGNYQIKKK